MGHLKQCHRSPLLKVFGAGQVNLLGGMSRSGGCLDARLGTLGEHVTQGIGAISTTAGMNAPH